MEIARSTRISLVCKLEKNISLLPYCGQGLTFHLFFVLDHNQIGRPRLGLDLKYAKKKKVCQEFVSVDWITCCIQSNLFFLLEIIPPVWSVAWSIALYSVGVENQECSIDEEIRFANMPACLSETWNVQNEWRTNCLPETQTLASLADWTLPVSLKHKLWQAWLIGLWLVRKEFLQNCGFPTVSHQNLFGIA